MQVYTGNTPPLAVDDMSKRQSKCPDRFTFSGPRKEKRRRKQEKGKEQYIGDDVGHAIVGPLNLDPSEMPHAELLQKTSEIMHDGLLKNHKRIKERKYKTGYDEF
ncbi:unnamed protein product [Cuscuta europaea]|uniref:Uncharacterized protein n=1 Tax=Cuscuta europaea TaxID=41803 RepID=A0A9P0ZTV8_CUSEU|nr:unnamed protein product [Cuscuta europaea]